MNSNKDKQQMWRDTHRYHSIKNTLFIITCMYVIMMKSNLEIVRFQIYRLHGFQCSTFMLGAQVQEWKWKRPHVCVNHRLQCLNLCRWFGVQGNAGHSQPVQLLGQTRKWCVEPWHEWVILPLAPPCGCVFLNNSYLFGVPILPRASYVLELSNKWIRVLEAV